MAHDAGGGFLYPFLTTAPRADTAALLEEVRHSSVQKCRDVVELRTKFLAAQEDALLAAGTAIAERLRDGGRLFTFGCGGSATDALDCAHDFSAPGPGRRPLPALALVVDTAIITAVANDVGFDNVFARQLIAYGRAGDVALGISTSGNSRALLQAFTQARRQRMLTVGVLGYDGGAAAAAGALDHVLVVHGDYVPRVQEAQATILHALRDIAEALP
jgi:D-sedoheptulose 7-phosphate isomerase